MKKFLFKIIVIIQLITISISTVNADNMPTYNLIKLENTNLSIKYDSTESNIIESFPIYKITFQINDKQIPGYSFVIGTNIEKNDIITAENLEEILSLGITDKNVIEELKNKINLYTYYGYGNNNMTKETYYLATQMLIWESIKESGFYNSEYYTNTYQKNISEIKIIKNNTELDLTTEMNTIQEFINTYNILPSFCINKKNMTIKDNTPQTYIDTFGVLSKYEITCSQNLKCDISDNKLNISSNYENQKGTITIKENIINNAIYKTTNNELLISSNNNFYHQNCEIEVEISPKLPIKNIDIYIIVSLSTIIIGFTIITIFSKSKTKK